MSTYQNVFGLRLSAIMEMILGLFLLILIDQFLGRGNGFMHIEPSPFWIVVLLIAAQYGVNEALLASVLSTLVFLFFADWPLRGADQNVFDYYYALMLNPILWIIAGIVVGALTERHLRKIVKLTKSIEDSQQREETISESYDFVKSRKESLEVQLTGKLTSSIKAYQAAKSIETLNPKDVMRGIEELVRSILGPQKFSIYSLDDNKLTANVLYGWTQEDPFGQEISSADSIYQMVVGQRDVLCISNSEHEAVLHRQGVLAGPIMDPDGQTVIGMLKIEQLDFGHLGLQTIETFKALCDWIGASMVNAEYYQTVKEESVINPEHNLMTVNYFKRQSDYLTALAKRVGFDLSLIVVRLSDGDKMPDADRLNVARNLSEAVKKALRNVDMAFEYQNTGEEYSLLLPATSQQGANVVRDKIAKELEGISRSLGNGSIVYHIKALHEV